jgi:hypothetical protein
MLKTEYKKARNYSAYCAEIAGFLVLIADWKVGAK